ncbi:MAG: hypothetical protein U0166_23905 [Acidobacteriota bacterium]
MVQERRPELVVLDAARGRGTDGAAEIEPILVAVVVLEAVAQRQELVVRDGVVELCRDEVLPERLLDRALVLGPEAARVDRVVGVLVLPLVGHEEVRPVSDDGTADGESFLKALVVRLREALILLEVLLPVEALAPVVAEDVAMEGIGAALGDDGDDAAPGPAVLRLEPLRDDLELLDRFCGVLLEDATDRVVVVVAAVDGDVDAAPDLGADGDSPHARLRGVEGISRGRPGSEDRKALECTPVEREVVDLVLVDDRREVRLFRVDEGGFVHDGDSRFVRGQLEREIEPRLLADVERHTSFCVRETRQRDPDAVIAGHDRREAVATIPFGHRPPNHSRGDVTGLDVGAGDRRASLVRDLPQEARSLGGRLSPERRAEESRCKCDEASWRCDEGLPVSARPHVTARRGGVRGKDPEHVSSCARRLETRSTTLPRDPAATPR